jgi:hypothetical protein
MSSKHLRVSFTLVVICFGASLYGCYLNSKLENHILLPPYNYYETDNMVYVSGTMTSILKENVAYPIITVDFKCEKNAGECNIIQAALNPNGYMHIYTESYNITLWDESYIVFGTTEFRQICTKWVYRIDRIRKKLIGVREKSSKYTEEACHGIGREKMEIEVIDGHDVLKKMGRFFY